MARWEPPDQVGKNECIGRRLFDEPMLAGAEGQKPFAGLQYRHFEDSRGQVSLDRLGQSGGIQKKVKNYLLPRAVAAGKTMKPAEPFNGWFLLQAHILEKPPKGDDSFPVFSSPIDGKELAENIYHAHVIAPDKMDDYSMALHLRELFVKHGNPYPISNNKTRLFETLRLGLLSLIKRIMYKLKYNDWARKK